ncbi:MAG: 4Fe-4S binding protein [Actinomycetota bacterium]|nr:4Fe-4S binding protein [Actinomycetota bacterium]
MDESILRLAKGLGFENAEKILHLYLYGRYLPHYLYHLGSPVGLAEKPPDEEIPPEIDEMIQIITTKVIRDILSPDTSTYHGKVLPLKLAEDLVSVKEDVELRGLERIIPYRLARDIILRNPSSIALVDCGCRMLRDNPCRPIDVCLAVGDPFASFAIEKGFMNARRISQKDAVDVLEAEDKRGHVHAAYFKDAFGDRFYAICNCCSCCCMGMLAWKKLKTPIIAPSGFVSKISDDCTSCGECQDVCPFGAITVEELAVVDREKCMGCGVCERACEYGAISLELEPSKGEPLDIKKLIREAQNLHHQEG